jgi:hypothetical protein
VFLVLYSRTNAIPNSLPHIRRVALFQMPETQLEIVRGRIRLDNTDNTIETSQWKRPKTNYQTRKESLEHLQSLISASNELSKTYKDELDALPKHPSDEATRQRKQQLNEMLTQEAQKRKVLKADKDGVKDSEYKQLMELLKGKRINGR